MNRDDPTDRLQQRQALCAMLDGDGAEADLACRVWGDDPQSRADWHAYNLIAELMRSDDVRCAPQHDARFLRRLRERLAAEPVVREPAAPVASAPRASWHRAWAAPIAVAAGFAAVAGAMVVARVAAPEGVPLDRSARLESPVAAPGALGLQSVATAASAPAVPALLGEGVLIRNAELDRYLAAHKQYSNTSALAVPGGAVRNAAAAAPGH